MYREMLVISGGNNQTNGDTITVPTKPIQKIALRGITLAAVAIILNGCVDCAPPGDPRRPIYPTFCNNFRSAQQQTLRNPTSTESLADRETSAASEQLSACPSPSSSTSNTERLSASNRQPGYLDTEQVASADVGAKE
jgi:hypothetical protein